MQAVPRKSRKEWAGALAGDLLTRREPDETWLQYAVKFQPNEESEIGGKACSTSMAILSLKLLEKLKQD